MYHICPYCGRKYRFKQYDPHGCFGCTTRTLDLSICGICRHRLPITPAGRRFVVPDAPLPLCDVCGAPLAPPEPAEADTTTASELAPALAGGC